MSFQSYLTMLVSEPLSAVLVPMFLVDIPFCLARVFEGGSFHSLI